MNYTRDMKENNVNENGKMAMTAKGIRLLLAGLVVIVSGYILMMGGGSDDPQVFNYAMFDFRRLVAAPIVIIAGLVIEVVAIMKVFK
jgi:hypothetical protein